jgi:hypothetical protein
MKKRSLFVVLILSALLMQYCKKASTADTTTTTTTLFSAIINDSTWTPTGVKATLTYNAANKTKIFSCTATNTSDQISLSIKQPALKLDSGFTARTYTIDSTTNIAPVYYTLNSSKAFAPLGTVKSGYIIVSSIDSLNKVITGSFDFVANRLNYDGNGNLTSITSVSISGGSFNNMPYTYIKQ